MKQRIQVQERHILDLWKLPNVVRMEVEQLGVVLEFEGRITVCAIWNEWLCLTDQDKWIVVEEVDNNRFRVVRKEVRNDTAGI